MALVASLETMWLPRRGWWRTPRYKNAIPVSPGETLTVVVGQRGRGGNRDGNPSASHGEDGGQSSVARGSTILVAANGGTGGRRQTSGTASGGSGQAAYDGGGNGGNGGPGQVTSVAAVAAVLGVTPGAGGNGAAQKRQRRRQRWFWRRRWWRWNPKHCWWRRWWCGCLREIERCKRRRWSRGRGGSADLTAPADLTVHPAVPTAAVELLVTMTPARLVVTALVALSGSSGACQTSQEHFPRPT